MAAAAPLAEAVDLLTVGPLPPGTLEALAARLSRRVVLACHVLPPRELPLRRIPKRDQIDANALLEAVEARALRESFLERRDLIVGLLNKVPGISCKVPGGAFYAWPNITQACALTGCADSDAFRRRLLDVAGVAVLADIHFGRRVPGEGQHLRFSYAASPDAIRDGVGRLDAFVRRHLK